MGTSSGTGAADKSLMSSADTVEPAGSTPAACVHRSAKSHKDTLPMRQLTPRTAADCTTQGHVFCRHACLSFNWASSTLGSSSSAEAERMLSSRLLSCPPVLSATHVPARGTLSVTQHTILPDGLHILRWPHLTKLHPPDISVLAIAKSCPCTA